MRFARTQSVTPNAPVPQSLDIRARKDKSQRDSWWLEGTPGYVTVIIGVTGLAGRCPGHNSTCTERMTGYTSSTLFSAPPPHTYTLHNVLPSYRHPPLGYERVYLLLHEVADTPFHILGYDIHLSKCIVQTL